MSNNQLINENLASSIHEFFKLNPDKGIASEWVTRVLTESFMTLKYKEFLPGKGEVSTKETTEVAEEIKKTEEAKKSAPINYATPTKNDNLYNE
jgi:hypothetical protein